MREIETNIHLILDTVRDTENIDIFRIEKYFGQDTWLKVLEQIQKKEVPWQCKMCNKAIKRNQESIAFDRCLLWYNFLCSSLSSKPKSRNWFCKWCKNKFRQERKIRDTEDIATTLEIILHMLGTLSFWSFSDTFWTNQIQTSLRRRQPT